MFKEGKLSVFLPFAIFLIFFLYIFELFFFLASVFVLTASLFHTTPVNQTMLNSVSVLAFSEMSVVDCLSCLPVQQQCQCNVNYLFIVLFVPQTSTDLPVRLTDTVTTLNS